MNKTLRNWLVGMAMAFSLLTCTARKANSQPFSDRPGFTISAPAPSFENISNARDLYHPHPGSFNLEIGNAGIGSPSPIRLSLKSTTSRDFLQELATEDTSLNFTSGRVVLGYSKQSQEGFSGSIPLYVKPLFSRMEALGLKDLESRLAGGYVRSSTPQFSQQRFTVGSDKIQFGLGQLTQGDTTKTTYYLDFKQLNSGLAFGDDYIYSHFAGKNYDLLFEDNMGTRRIGATYADMFSFQKLNNDFTISLQKLGLEFNQTLGVNTLTVPKTGLRLFQSEMGHGLEYSKDGNYLRYERTPLDNLVIAQYKGFPVRIGYGQHSGPQVTYLKDFGWFAINLQGTPATGQTALLSAKAGNLIKGDVLFSTPCFEKINTTAYRVLIGPSNEKWSLDLIQDPSQPLKLIASTGMPLDPKKNLAFDFYSEYDFAGPLTGNRGVLLVYAVGKCEF